jgi:hypothetical protein
MGTPIYCKYRRNLCNYDFKYSMISPLDARRKTLDRQEWFESFKARDDNGTVVQRFRQIQRM